MRYEVSGEGQVRSARPGVAIVWNLSISGVIETNSLAKYEVVRVEGLAVHVSRESNSRAWDTQKIALMAGHPLIKEFDAACDALQRELGRQLKVEGWVISDSGELSQGHRVILQVPESGLYVWLTVK